MASRALRGVPTVFVGILIIAVLFTAYTAQKAFATHQPADKVSASGSTVEIFAPEEKVVLLHETMKVSSPSDLILQLTAECSIDTNVRTGDDDEGGPDEQFDYAEAEGHVEVWVEIDNKPVPVSTDDVNGGRVVLCHRYHDQYAYESETQEDEECQAGEAEVTVRVGGTEVRHSSSCDDGLDEMDVYLHTREANGFNWFALNGGTFFDDPANGNNILDIVVYGELTAWTSDADDQGQQFCGVEPEGESACAEAAVGNRTLIIEPVHAANHEVVAPTSERTPGKG